MTACDPVAIPEFPNDPATSPPPAYNRVATHLVAFELTATGSAIEGEFNLAGVPIQLDSITRATVLGLSPNPSGEFVSITFRVITGGNSPSVGISPNQVQFSDSNGNFQFWDSGYVTTFSLLEQLGETALNDFQVRVSGEARVQVIATVRDV